MSQHARQQKKWASAPPSQAVKPSVPSTLAPAARSGTHTGGQALDKHTQAEMSAKFGHDFSQVRIHTDARAGESASALGANAYALGSDIAFGPGQYVPGSPETERLLAHELTHVVQQSQFGAGDWSRFSQRSDASEREAESLASQVMMGRSVSVQAAPQAAVARDEDDGPPDTPSVREKEKPGGPNDWGDKGFSLKWNWGDLWPKSMDVDPNLGQGADPFHVPLPRPAKPDAPKPGPGSDFVPKPAPDRPYMPPPFQYTPSPNPAPGIQPPTGPIAPLTPPLGPVGPLTPPSLFPPAPSPVAPMVPPLNLDPITPPAAPDPSAPVPVPDTSPLPDDQRYA